MELTLFKKFYNDDIIFKSRHFHVDGLSHTDTWQPTVILKMGLLLYAMLVIRQVLVQKWSSNTSFCGVQILRRLMTLREGLVPIFKQLESSGTEMEDFFF